jgi:hypothetical protein
MDQKLTIVPSGDTLVIRTGEAEKIYPPKKVNITGNIQAPGEYYQKRQPQISDKLHLTHVIVDIENLTIKLTINETSEFAEYVSGKLEHFKEFTDFGINRQKKYGIQELYKMLKLKRAYFQRREDHAVILEQLRKFEAKTEIEFQSMNDFKGATALKKIESCKTNLTYNFVLNIPIFKGFPPSSFPVEIEFEPHDGGIICWLASQDLAELEIKNRDEIMDKEIKQFDSVVVIKQ